VSPTPDSTLADPQQIIADLRRELAECRAERDEALAQQTTTAEVLGVINSSPGNLAPVFDAILEQATRFCEAAFGTLWTYDGERFQAVALRQVPQAYADFLSQAPLRPVPFSGLGRVAAGESVVHFLDVASNDAYQGSDAALHALLELGKAHTTVAVPLRKDGGVLGAITAYRQEVRPFSDKQIALLQCGGRKASVILSISDLKDALARFDSPQGSSSTGWSGAKLPQPIAKLRVSVDCTKMKTLTVPRPQKTKGRFA
jgi:transcriptional regulator with GAF, ATPase, and Fis domain